MPLGDPPAVGVLAALVTRPTAGTVLHRVFRADRPHPWFFAAVPTGSDPRRHGRFDLPTPDGACYLATSLVAAVLGTFQHLVGGLLPDDELRSRDRAQVTAPTGSPPAVNLTAARSRGAGVHAALWADHDSARTQAWADQLRRAGHRALLHDPTGRLRAVTLFDKAGAHAPYDDDLGWRLPVTGWRVTPPCGPRSPGARSRSPGPTSPCLSYGSGIAGCCSPRS